MATKAIGRGTVNLSINVRKRVRTALGRTAFRLNVSTGEFCRRLFVCGARFVTLVRTAGQALEADRRALDSLRAARSPSSPGGVTITAAEANQIEADIRASAEADARIASGEFAIEGRAS